MNAIVAIWVIGVMCFFLWLCVFWPLAALAWFVAGLIVTAGLCRLLQIQGGT